MAVRRLADVCEAVVDCPHSTPVWTDSGVLVLRSQNIRGGRLDLSAPSYTDEKHYEERTRRIIPQAHDLVITREAPMGEVCLLPHGLRCCLGQRMVLLRTKASVMAPRYLLYALQSPSVQHDILVNEGTGSTVSNLRIPILESLPIPCPPLPAQKRIAHILGTLDDKIELNRRMNATLEAMSRAIFKSWFVDFDPVRQKAAGKRPVGMDAKTAALFPDSFEDSEIGEVPKGWLRESVYVAAEVIYGAPFASALFNNAGEGVPLIRIRDLPTESPDAYTSERHPKGYLVQPGDVVVGMDGEFRAYLWGGLPGWLNQRVCVFKPKLPFGAAFLREMIAEPLRQVEATETATTVIHLGKSDVDRFRFVSPGVEVVVAFQNTCQPLCDSVIANRQLSRTLAALRDALLPKLLSGEIRVPEAEAAVEEAIG